MKIFLVLTKIIRGYLSDLRNILYLLLILAVALLLSAVIVYPLWYWAIHSTASYTLGVLLTIGLLFLSYLLRKVLKIWHSSPLKFLVKTLWTVISLGGIFITLFLFTRGSVVPAAGILLLMFLFWGYFLYARKKPPKLGV